MAHCAHVLLQAGAAPCTYHLCGHQHRAMSHSHFGKGASKVARKASRQ